MGNMQDKAKPVQSHKQQQAAPLQGHMQGPMQHAGAHSILYVVPLQECQAHINRLRQHSLRHRASMLLGGACSLSLTGHCAIEGGDEETALQSGQTVEHT